MKEFDYIIIGGGCAGLSLAYELEINGKLKDKTLAIIEPRKEYKRDKTWSFWKVFDHNFEDCVIKSWNNFTVNSSERSHEVKNKNFPYQSIDSGKFYEKINSKKELVLYSYRVAGTVGLMMSKILKVKNKEALKGAIDLGIAMQLTNIARDVCEDKDRNRQYIKPDFSAIKETINESQIFYKKSFSSISSIPLRSRFSVIVARRVYKKIGDYILKQKNTENYNKAGKIYVPIFGKIIQTFLSAFDFVKLLFVKQLNYDNHIGHNILEKEINFNERI